MESSTTLKSITSGQQNCRVIARLIRLWDAKIIIHRYGDGLLSIDGILLDEDVSVIVCSKLHIHICTQNDIKFTYHI